MRVILRIQRIRPRIPQLLIRIRHRLEVIHIAGSIPNLLRRLSRVRHKPRSSAHISSAFPEVVRRLRGDDDRGALRDVRPRCGLDVVAEGVNGGAIFAGFAGLLAGATAVAAAVVVGACGAATVVVPELDDDNVPGFD